MIPAATIREKQSFYFKNKQSTFENGVERLTQ